jgi:3-deoxy-D-manno-octulosonic-acid transferase
MEQAVTAALKLVENPERRAVMAQAALGFSSSNRGAAERTAAAVLAIAQAAEPVATAAAPLDDSEPPRAEPTLD